MEGQAMLRTSGACFRPDLTDLLTSMREPLDGACVCFEIQPWLRIVPTTMLVSCIMQAQPRDRRTELGDGHRHRMLLPSVTLHWHNIGDPEIQGYQKLQAGDRSHPCLLIFKEAGRLRTIRSMGRITGVRWITSWDSGLISVIWVSHGRWKCTPFAAFPASPSTIRQ
ncbi:hypothetical protein BDZ45DRAFT_182649 [Acephala macrosclerotiorum]|nr:hypothetical protein BDZ45DRAFT_182649 [Acephala macrosclerotiorum]